MHISYKTGSQLPTQIAPGLYMTLPGFGTITGIDLEGNSLTVHMKLAMTAEGVRPVSFEVLSEDDSVPITGTTLRAMRVWDMAREVLSMAVMRGEQTTTGAPASVTIGDWSLSGDDVVRLRNQGPTDESLQWVAHFYNLAEVLGLSPAKSVETELGLPRTTATKWIKRARDKGLLGLPATGGSTSSHTSSSLPVDEMVEWLGWKEGTNGEHPEAP